MTTAQQQLAAFIQKICPLTETEVAQFIGAFQETKIKKRQFIVQPGFTAQHRHYVVEGAFRAYVVGDDGSDHTISFAIEDWWISDYNSYIYQQPATMFVIALEDSVVLRIAFAQEQALKQANHHFETIFRTMAERGLAFLQRRAISNLTLTAAARYEHFMERYAGVAQRLPQYALASYLGMSAEFLSKIRNRRSGKKS